MTRLEFWFDFGSPYSYLAHSQLDGLACEVAVRPMAVLQVMEAVGNQPTTLLSAAKGRYAMADLGRWAARYGVPLNPGNVRRNDGQACASAVLAAGRMGQAREATAALFHAYWGEGAKLADTGEILNVLGKAGLDAKAIGALIDSDEIAAELKANTQEAAERGVFGAPTIFVGEDMFFGNDRLDFVRDRLAESAVAAGSPPRQSHSPSSPASVPGPAPPSPAASPTAATAWPCWPATPAGWPRWSGKFPTASPCPAT